MGKNILMIAYHYPPVGESSGVHRTLKFTSYLLEYDWQPTVLTVSPKAYERTSEAQLSDIPKEIEVKRCFAVDTARHLSVKGRYVGWMALPDRWISWVFSGVFNGWRLVKRKKPVVIWSTYPMATAHLIGYFLHKLTGLPWVADFRDSMTEDNYPSEKRKWKAFRWIEKKVVEHAKYVVFTTPNALRMYKERYPSVPAEKFVQIANGFDEEKFVDVERSMSAENSTQESDKLTFVHSGLLYPNERDPRSFFKAISLIKKRQPEIANKLSIVLRASGYEHGYKPMLNELGIEHIVSLEPPVSYDVALKEMLSTDGLLLFQASSCNHQIPAKAYEYFRARKPVFAMTDENGDTANLLKEAGYTTIVDLMSEEDIYDGLIEFITSIKESRVNLPSDQIVSSYSRKAGAQALANLLNSIS